MDQIYALYHYDDMLRVRLVKINPLSDSAELPIWLSLSRTVKMTDEELNFFKLTVEVLAIDVGRTIHTRAYNLIQFEKEYPTTELLTVG